MNSADLITLRPGDYVLVAFGRFGTQVACVVAVRKSGTSLMAHKFLANSQRWTGARKIVAGEVQRRATADEVHEVEHRAPCKCMRRAPVDRWHANWCPRYPGKKWQARVSEGDGSGYMLDPTRTIAVRERPKFTPFVVRFAVDGGEPKQWIRFARNRYEASDEAAEAIKREWPGATFFEIEAVYETKVRGVSEGVQRRLTCAVCGSDAGRWHQHWNRDTGYGICTRCVVWLTGRGMSAEELERLYGRPGINYEPVTAEAV